jgi:uncharacterized protein (TIGR00730 family)
MPAITVDCSSSTALDPEFHAPAVAIGRELAHRGITLVYGGGSLGLMGEIARACRDNGGCVIGVITRRLVEMERADSGCDQLIVVDTMRERKRLLEGKGDALLVLPGGIGTYEEFFEILVGRHLGEHAKPIGVLNCRGYYNPLIALIEHGIEHRFIHPSMREKFFIDPDPRAVVGRLCTAAGDAMLPRA